MSDHPLEQQVRQVLGEMETLSHGTVQSWNASGGGGENDAIFPPGGRAAPHLFWRERFEQADPLDWPEMLNEARTELDSYRRRTAPLPPPETESALAARVIEKGRGWTLEQVALALRCSVSFARKARQNAGVQIFDGEPMPNAPITASREERIRRVRELKDRGDLSLRQIAMIVGCNVETVRRDLA